MKKITCADGTVWLRWFNQGEEDEFACKCKCGDGINKMRKEFLTMLDDARYIADVPFIINSGYRCPKHNRAVGSTSSNHTSGQAADIRATDSVPRGHILLGLYKAGFTRVGISPGFIHCDTNPIDPSVTVWYY